MTGDRKETTRRKRPLRLSRRGARIAAWFGGGLSFISLWASIGLNPKPPAAASERAEEGPAPQQANLVIKRTTRRVVVTRVIQVRQEPQIRYVTVVAPVQTTTSSSGGSSGGAPKPAPAPTTDTKGS